MGGIGSGRHYRLTRKATVEESLTLSIDQLRRLGKGAIAWRGTFWWSEPVTGKEVGRLAYMVNLKTLTLYLKYGSTSDGETEDIASYFGLCTSRLFSGGLRFWISCTYCEWLWRWTN